MNMFGYVCMYIYPYAYICVWGGWESENMYLYISPCHSAEHAQGDYALLNRYLQFHAKIHLTNYDKTLQKMLT